ncbi:hypothetical protein SAMN05421766_103693 [Zobellia uliginosa]|uniref:CarboxypepD_reg-like domain-containing protein n=1 Tax=Zobellia uliginosa TaxID=143224 RepID=A0ABY1KTJ4_9FLAO|nr:carboxypeptidase regulatory-like domain-containing protein [Zobellia uliginosa]SIS73370.1 hypothetical protein SAMN05421766_103693 [Zobellia uliginosa]
MTSNKTITIAVLLVTLSSCISRLEQHALYGTVVNIQKHPIVNCSIGETTTDSSGYFYLPEKRYNQFLLSELFIMEAPPIAYNIPVKKEGYKTTYISFINPRGGGTKKGASRNLDTIYLKKKINYRTNE